MDNNHNLNTIGVDLTWDEDKQCLEIHISGGRSLIIGGIGEEVAQVLAEKLRLPIRKRELLLHVPLNSQPQVILSEINAVIKVWEYPANRVNP